MTQARRFLVPLLAFATVNGVFSPAVGLAFLIVPFVTPWPIGDILPLRLMVASLLVSTTTLILAGIPAAIFERIRRSPESTAASMWIWLAFTAVLSLPGVVNAFAIGF